MTKQQATLVAFQTLHNFEAKTSKETGHMFTHTQPYTVEYKPTEVVIFGWGYSGEMYEGKAGKYGVKVSYESSNPVEVPEVANL